MPQKDVAAPTSAPSVETPAPAPAPAVQGPEDLSAGNAGMLAGMEGFGISGVLDMLGLGGGGQAAAPPPAAAGGGGAGAHAAPAMPRTVEGKGGYMYVVLPDQSIVVTKAPPDGAELAGKTLHPGSSDPVEAKRYDAIKGEITPLIAQQDAERAAAKASAVAAAAPSPSSSPDRQPEEQGWGDWLGSCALEAVHIEEQLNPAFWLGDAITKGFAYADDPDAGAPSEAPASPATETEAAATPATPAEITEAPAAPAAPPRFVPRDVPAASAPVTGTDAIHSDSLGAAEAYLPKYDADGKLVSGVGTYGFDQHSRIGDDEARHWAVGEADASGKEWTAGAVGKADKDTKRQGLTQLWCSGLSSATLDDLGYDLDAAIPGQFYWENGKQKPVTLRNIVEGMPEALAQTEEQDQFVTQAVATFKAGLADQYTAAQAIEDEKERKKALDALDASVSEFRAKTLYGLAGNFGDDASADDARVKGAAGAFELAGIGAEVSPYTAVRPGDFCQRRDVDSPKGHAFQIHSVVAKGDIVIGLGGSPEVISQGPSAPEPAPDGNGQIVRGAEFRISEATNPNCVLSAAATDWSVIESNIAGAYKHDKTAVDPKKDGGVAVRDDAKVPTDPSSATRFYVGRLASSPWYGSA